MGDSPGEGGCPGELLGSKLNNGPCRQAEPERAGGYVVEQGAPNLT